MSILPEQNVDARTASEAAAVVPPKVTGLKRIWRAFFYSLAGLSAARREPAFWTEIMIAAVLIPVALMLPVAGVGKAMMIAVVTMVIVVELLNCAIEAIVDLVSPQYHVLAKRAKDYGSAAVLLTLVMVPVVWLLVLFG
jgi:diacylglycerol kinase (ATP)